jgi:hypothetical protein
LPGSHGRTGRCSSIVVGEDSSPRQTTVFLSFAGEIVAVSRVRGDASASFVSMRTLSAVGVKGRT